MTKIIGIGNALVDVLVRLDGDSELARLGLPKGGMQLIDDARQQSLSQQIAPLKPTRATGGSAGNAVLALARLGARPGFVGRVGDDEPGRFYLDNCRSAGIDARLIVSEGHTGVANAFITPDAERTFATYLGVAGQFSVDDIHPGTFGGYQLLHIEGYLVQDNKLIRHLCQTAKSLGMRVSIDLASYNVVRDNLPLLRDLVARYVDIVFANEEESMAFTQGLQPEDALEEIARMVGVAVVKLGGRGAMAACGTERAFVPGRTQGVVDTTGAGDFFAGGFLYGFSQGVPLEQCLQLGSLLAGNVIQFVGTRLPEATWQEIIHNSQFIIHNS